MSEIMSSLSGIDSREDIAENRINEFKVSSIEISVKKVKSGVGENICKLLI